MGGTVGIIDFDGITIGGLRRLGGTKWATPGTIGAFVAEMDFGIAPVITAVLAETVERGEFGYLPKKMEADLQRATSAFVDRRFGWQVAPDRVRPLGDVIAALTSFLDHFTPPGSPAIVPTPAYMPFVSLLSIAGRQPIEVPMARDDGRFVYDLDALDAAFARGARSLILCNPHNPTGRVMDRGELEALCAVVEEHGARVFSDEIHAPIVHDGHTHIPYASINEVTARHTVTAMSASKAWNLPGLKCAQLILTNEDDAATWARVGILPEHGAANLGLVGNTAAFDLGEPWLDEAVAYIGANRHFFAAQLAEKIPGAHTVVPEGTYLAWVDFSECGIEGSVADFFTEHAGVILTDGPLCGSVGQGHARFNLGTTRPIIEEAVDRMATALNAVGRR